MLNFLYSGDYHSDVEAVNVLPLLLHAQMLKLGDKYQIPSLVICAQRKYSNAVQEEPKHNDYLSSIPELYMTSASGAEARAVAVSHARRVLGNLIVQEDLRANLKQIVNQVPEYSFDVLEAFVKSQVRGLCGHCGSEQPAICVRAKCLRCGDDRMFQTF